LNLKNREIDELKNKRDELERQVQSEPTDAKNGKISKAQAELDGVNQQLTGALEEKNKLYDELVQSTKDLLETNEAIQENAQKIARLSQELEFRRVLFQSS